MPSWARVTLNPIPHLDLMGSLVVPLMLLALPGDFIFGWAKPVPVNPYRLKNPRKDMLWISAAGPLAGFILGGLVYVTILSIVPVLAIIFSILKGFGVHRQLEPFLYNFLAPLGEKGAELTDQVILDGYRLDPQLGLVDGVDLAVEQNEVGCRRRLLPAASGLRAAGGGGIFFNFKTFPSRVGWRCRSAYGH